MIAVCSLFRDSVVWHGRKINQVDRYFSQLKNQTYGFNNLQVYCLEGESKDNTFDTLSKYSSTNVKIYKDDEVSDTVIESIEKQERLVNLSRIANNLLSKIDYTDISHVLWIESDLIINNRLIDDLLDVANLIQEESYIIAPYVYLQNHKHINYDTWGFRHLDGERFKIHINKRDNVKSHLIKLSSVGSCALISADILKSGINFGSGCFVELCQSAINYGAGVYASPVVEILHPGTILMKNRWI